MTPARIALLVVALLLAAGLGWWMLASPGSVAPTPATSAPLPEAGIPSTAEATEPASAEALMQRARAQLARAALIAPIGDNAVETYLAVLQLDPEHSAARSALVEMQPVVSDGIRGALANSEWPEADRLLAMLRALDPESVLLEPLQAELSRRRAEAERLLAQAAVLPASPSPATVAPSTLPSAATGSSGAPSAPVPAESTPESRPVAAATPPTAELPTPAPVSAPPPPVAEAAPPPALSDTPARLLNNPPLNYPSQARRQRLEGWVEVEVRIDERGEVTEARVLRGEPNGVFDREALRTAQRWRFSPREVDGRPVASTARRRVNFSLGNS